MTITCTVGLANVAGAPLAGQVELLDPLSGAILAKGPTNAQGVATLAYPDSAPKNPQLVATSTGYNPYNSVTGAPVNLAGLTAFSTKLALSAAPKSTTYLRALAFDAKYDLLAGISVGLSLYGSPSFAHGITATDGTYIFDNLTPGETYTVHAQAPTDWKVIKGDVITVHKGENAGTVTLTKA